MPTHRSRRVCPSRSCSESSSSRRVGSASARNTVHHLSIGAAAGRSDRRGGSPRARGHPQCRWASSGKATLGPPASTARRPEEEVRPLGAAVVEERHRLPPALVGEHEDRLPVLDGISKVKVVPTHSSGPAVQRQTTRRSGAARPPPSTRTARGRRSRTPGSRRVSHRPGCRSSTSRPVRRCVPTAANTSAGGAAGSDPVSDVCHVPSLRVGRRARSSPGRIRQPNSCLSRPSVRRWPRGLRAGRGPRDGPARGPGGQAKMPLPVWDR